MPFLFSPLLQTLICFFSSTLPANASSFFQFISHSPTLVTILAAFAGAIVGSLVSGHYLVKKVREEMKLEFFREVRDKFYAPFQEITEGMINQNGISVENRVKLREFLNNNKKLIAVCPNTIKKEMRNLETDLGDDDYIKVIERIKEIRGEISKVINKFSLK